MRPQAPFGPSVASPCHPWVTTTNLSYRFPISETSATALCGTTGMYNIQYIHTHTHIYIHTWYIADVYIYIISCIFIAIYTIPMGYNPPKNHQLYGKEHWEKIRTQRDIVGFIWGVHAQDMAIKWWGKWWSTITWGQNELSRERQGFPSESKLEAPFMGEFWRSWKWRGLVQEWF